MPSTTRRALDILTFKRYRKQPRITVPQPVREPWADHPVGFSPDFEPGTFPQSDCLLFTKLPYEVRLIIYHYLGIFQSEHAFAGTVELWGPRTRSSLGMARGCRVHPDDKAIDEWVASVRLRSILRVCRRMYAEVINLLYSSNLFHLDDVKALSVLLESTHPTHIRRIKKLSFLYSHRTPPVDNGVYCGPDWAALVRPFIGLTEATIMIGARYWHQQKLKEHLYTDGWAWMEHEVELLNDAKRVDHIKRLRLVLSWSKGERELPKINALIERSTDNGGAIRRGADAWKASSEEPVDRSSTEGLYEIERHQ